jgi:UDP-N-acetylmuramoyl-tripeptide--D-alanyl-D-alanine ligase
LWLIPPGDGAAVPHGLSHDSRTLRAGQVYLAVAGENHDGRAFVGDAATQGAALCIVPEDDADEPEDFTLLRRRLPDDLAVPTLVVEDAVEALQELASAYRDHLSESGCKVLAVVGSNGKTTTRHLLHHALQRCGRRGTQSPRSFNNHLGVPLTLLAAEPGDDFVACEIGTNHPGEIAALADLAWPDAVILTSIGHEHMEFFRTLDNVAKEESAILPFVRPHGFVTLPAEHAPAVMPYYDVQEGVTLLPVKDTGAVPDDFPLLGEHNRMNAALVAALLRWLEVPEEQIAAAWAGVQAPPGRLRRIELGQGVTVIDDSYNANPDSVRAALAVLAEPPGRPAGGRRVAVLGTMLELGETSAAAHAAARAAAEATADRVILIGEGYGAEPWDDAAADRVAAQIEPGDTVLLKASRGVGLERIIPVLQQRFQ